jgi:hypothetical protein
VPCRSVSLNRRLARHSLLQWRLGVYWMLAGMPKRKSRLNGINHKFNGIMSSKCLLQEMDLFDVQVSLVEPGFVRTELFGRNRDIAGRRARLLLNLRRNLPGKMFDNVWSREMTKR